MATFHVFCETDNQREYFDTQDTPAEVCPNNPAHTVRAGSLTWFAQSVSRKDQFHAVLGFGSGEHVITTTGTWQDIDRRTLKPSFLAESIPALYWSVACDIKTTGPATARIIFVETEVLPTPVNTVLKNVVLPDTSGDWQSFQFTTSVTLSSGWRSYGFGARRDTATSLEIRGLNAALLERTR